MLRRIVTAWLVFSACLLASRQPEEEIFDGLSTSSIPYGKPARRKTSASVEGCQAVCARDSRCKAFAFRTRTAACYIYDRVYNGEETSRLGRQMGLYSAGLAIVDKEGFVSAFKKSSYPSHPIMLGGPGLRK